MKQWIPVTLEEMVTPESAALVMWDFQNGLGGRAAGLDGIVAAAGRLLDAADAADVPVIWSRHTVPPLEQVTSGSLYRMMRKQGVATLDDLQPFMHEGSPERDFIPQLQPRAHDSVIDKSTPSFFVGTPLHLRLTAMHVRTLVFAGVATDIGIDLTAKHAYALGYYPVVAVDAVGSYSEGRHETGLAAIQLWIPTTTAADIAAMWDRSAD